jgi:hypothetical protein
MSCATALALTSDAMKSKEKRVWRRNMAVGSMRATGFENISQFIGSDRVTVLSRVYRMTGVTGITRKV